MRRRSRRLKVLKWLGAGATLLLAAAMAESFRAPHWLVVTSYDAAIAYRGSIMVMIDGHSEYWPEPWMRTYQDSVRRGENIRRDEQRLKQLDPNDRAAVFVRRNLTWMKTQPAAPTNLAWKPFRFQMSCMECWKAAASPPHRYWMIGVPMSYGLAFVGGLTLLAWWRDRPFRPGRCAACGYDLTGNVSGVCPECGTAAPSRRADAGGAGRVGSGPPVTPSQGLKSGETDC